MLLHIQLSLHHTLLHWCTYALTSSCHIGVCDVVIVINKNVMITAYIRWPVYTTLIINKQRPSKILYIKPLHKSSMNNILIYTYCILLTIQQFVSHYCWSS